MVLSSNDVHERFDYVSDVLMTDQQETECTRYPMDGLKIPKSLNQGCLIRLVVVIAETVQIT